MVIGMVNTISGWDRYNYRCASWSGAHSASLPGATAPPPPGRGLGPMLRMPAGRFAVTTALSIGATAPMCFAFHASPVIGRFTHGKPIVSLFTALGALVAGSKLLACCIGST